MSDQTKTKVLALVDYYLPGYRGGGPAVSVSRIVDCLQGDIDFNVYTRDRDLGEKIPYEGIESCKWIERNGVKHYYAPPVKMTLVRLLKVLNDVKPDVIYLNSYFSRLTRQTLVLRSLGLLRKMPILIAPRGEFSQGALGIKSFKKKIYIFIANMFKFHGGVTWQVSSKHELRDAKAVIHTTADYFIKAPDIVDRSNISVETSRPEKVSGSAKFAFISRIAPIKNLLGALQMLKEVKGEVDFTIYGPAEDVEYWSQCQQAIEELPANIRCHIMGPVPSPKVMEKLAGHHFFLFPTLGENFGHVIPEALAAGCPVLLSDRTPWLDFAEHNVGWVTPLEDQAKWIESLQQAIDMNADDYNAMHEATKVYIAAKARSPKDIEANRKLFEVTIQNQSRFVA